MHFAQVYRFVGDIFDPDTPCHIEAHLQKLKDMDGITVKTVSVLQNSSFSYFQHYNSQSALLCSDEKNEF
jgi:hypothetical protein